MQIGSTRPPWMKKGNYGHKLNPNPFYNSPSWRRSRKARRLGSTMVNGHSLMNIFCVDCFKEKGLELPGNNDDHIIAIKDGGDPWDYDNRQTLCNHHHAIKSAKEGNNRKQKNRL